MDWTWLQAEKLIKVSQRRPNPRIRYFFCGQSSARVNALHGVKEASLSKDSSRQWKKFRHGILPGQGTAPTWRSIQGHAIAAAPAPRSPRPGCWPSADQRGWRAQLLRARTRVSQSCGMHRGTSPTKTRPLLGPYCRPMHRITGGSWGGGRLLVGEVPLYGFARDSMR